MILDINSSWGHRYSGSKGLLVTSNKEIFEYQEFYNLIPENLTEGKVNYIKKIIDLNDDEYNLICDFIKNEILSKDFKNITVFDINWNIIVDYDGVQKIIKNNKGFNNEIDIYDKTEKLLKNIILNNLK